MNKRLRKILCILVLSGLSFGAFAGGLDNKNGIGTYVFMADRPFGGLQYERRVGDSNSVGLKFGLFAYYDNDSTTEPLNMSFTMEVDYSLFETTYKDKICSRLFLYALAGYQGGIDRKWDYVNEAPKEETFYNNALTSLGVGFDFIFMDHLSVPLQLGMVGIFPYQTKIGFTVCLGVRYVW